MKTLTTILGIAGFILISCSQPETTTAVEGPPDTSPDTENSAEPVRDGESTDSMVEVVYGCSESSLAKRDELQPLSPEAQEAIDQTQSADSITAETYAPEQVIVREIFDDYDMELVSQTDDEIVLYGISTSNDTDAFDITFKRSGSNWEPTGWTYCLVQPLVAGYGNASFILNPEVEPAGNEVQVLATEVNCANGAAPDGREVRAVVVEETDEYLQLLVLVEPVEGEANCPGNPPFEFTIDETTLGGPLDGRQILDASESLPIERSWPPSKEELCEVVAQC